MSTERRLYVGAPVRVSGWEVYDDSAHEDVDHVGPIDRLQGVADESVTILYVNALGRLNFEKDALRAMQEWHRALKPGTAFLLTVVDAAAVGAALNDKPNFDEQVMLLRLLGNQKSHWTAEATSICLQIAGFVNVRRAESLNLFADVSQLALRGRSLALNILADKK